MFGNTSSQTPSYSIHLGACSSTIFTDTSHYIKNNYGYSIVGRMGGPCVIESEKHVLNLVSNLKEITSELKIPFIFKASYDKANRSSCYSYRGPVVEEGLKNSYESKKRIKLNVITDVHTENQTAEAAQDVDFLQVPAFLSRQIDLIKACTLTGKLINIKKGQFLTPEGMFNADKKSKKFGRKNLSLTERGVSFGYHNLVVNFRSLEIMKQAGSGYL
jgi:2-dehydro-3-deoxyphosphooctonate aldolase (KDO 8-P synthase)